MLKLQWGKYSKQFFTNKSDLGKTWNIKTSMNIEATVFPGPGRQDIEEIGKQKR